MPLDVTIVPCLADNYAYLLRCPQTGLTVCVDVPDPAPIVAALDALGGDLHYVFLTHHHADHIQGTADLVAATGAQTVGAAADAHRLPPLQVTVDRGDLFWVGRAKGVVRDATGHTRGHIALHFPAEKLLFSADSLMAAGCGRLFEGTPAEMWETLTAFAAYPPETLVYSGHDYLAGNLRFAAHVDPDNPAIPERLARVEAMRAAGAPRMPWSMEDERATNPFLRADLPALRAAAGLPKAPAAEVFAALRAMKDRF
jgi:hydroxyacylglutathione hydrolase